jgi:hypothetical protein
MVHRRNVQRKFHQEAPEVPWCYPSVTEALCRLKKAGPLRQSLSIHVSNPQGVFAEHYIVPDGQPYGISPKTPLEIPR